MGKSEVSGGRRWGGVGRREVFKNRWRGLQKEVGVGPSMAYVPSPDSVWGVLLLMHALPMLVQLLLN